MKKRRILYLLPFATLILGGCTFQDVKTWVGKNVYFPVRNWVHDFINPKHSETEEKLTEKALLEAVSKTLLSTNATAESYIDGELMQKMEFESTKQLISNGTEFYSELVDGVTYVFALDPEDEEPEWMLFTATEESIIGLGYTSEDLEQLKTVLHDEKNTVEYGKDYCLITYDENSILSSIIEQYPDYEAAIRETYKASEIKASVKLTVADGYLVNMLEYGAEVVKDATDTEGTSFVCNTGSFESKFSKIGSTSVSRPEGIESVPPEE